MNGKLVIVSLLLVATSSLALGCGDFEFERSPDGKVSRLQMDNISALVKIEVDEEWTGYVKHGDKVTISNQTGATKTVAIKDLPEKEQVEFDHLMKTALRGTAIIGISGKFFLNANDGQVMNVGVNGEGAVDFLGGELSAYLYADRSGLMYEHNFTFLKSKRLATIEVSKSTCDIRVYPLSK